MHALDGAGFLTLPVYVTKDGVWVRGDKSFYRPETFVDLDRAVKRKAVICSLKELTRKEKIDVFFPAFHGRYGEDGAVQGVLEMNNLAYVGCDVQASAIGMDKAVSKRIVRAQTFI